MALDDVAQQQHVDVALEQEPPVGGGERLGFGEAAGFQKAREMMVEGRALWGGEGVRARGDFLLVVPQEFAEAEGVDGDFPSAPAHGGGDLPAEELGGRAGEEDFVACGIEQAADELLPAGDALDFVEEKRDRRIVGRGEKPQVGVGDEVELFGRQVA